ncbi:GIY-YIG nuclease family protein [Bradyrhizobium sp. PMVTL-01]|uniref:GIY-YIG nuclease family protein n=1 Tax=Bradyrhizobium sp. PMVTL-01 TaxID=3434999 RepID=UPI003F71A66D
MTGSFVYVIKGVGNHHKIGVSTDPIARLATLQTGSHEPLDFAYIGVTSGTGFSIERAAHDLLAAYRASGEWFAVPASIATGAVIEAAGRVGEPIQQVPPQLVPTIIQMASQPEAPAPRRVHPFWKWALAILLVLLAALIAIAIWVPDPPPRP